MAHYSTRLLRPTGSTALPIGSLGAGATNMRRGTIYLMEIGHDGGAAPADVAMRLDLQRCTAFGTSTAVTPRTKDAADSIAAGALAGENHTVDATRTAGEIISTVMMNQKTTFLWQTLPELGGLVWPATASNGFALIAAAFSSGTPGLCAWLNHVE